MTWCCLPLRASRSTSASPSLNGILACSPPPSCSRGHRSGATAFLAEFVLGWVLGMTIRVFIQTALIGLSIPLFSTLVIELTSGGDPTFWGAFGVLLASVLFFVLSWLIPNRAVGLLARGLAISGTDVLAGLSSAARGIRGFAGAGGAVVSGASRLLRQERA